MIMAHRQKRPLVPLKINDVKSPKFKRSEKENPDGKHIQPFAKSN